jgi:hypothetical protein
VEKNTQNDTAGTVRVLTDAEINEVSGGGTKAQAVEHANDVADQMIAILQKYHLT